MRRSACLLLLAAACSDVPRECEPADRPVKISLGLVPQMELDRSWIDVPCTTLNESPPYSLRCPGLVQETGTATIVLGIDATPPLPSAKLVRGDPIALTYVERHPSFVGGTYFRVRQGGAVRLIAQRFSSLAAKEALLPADAAIEPYEPFTVQETEPICGMQNGATRLGLRFESADTSITVFDRQTVETERWSIRVAAAVVYEQPDDCDDCGGSAYDFLIAGTRQ